MAPPAAPIPDAPVVTTPTPEPPPPEAAPEPLAAVAEVPDDSGTEPVVAGPDVPDGAGSEPALTSPIVRRLIAERGLDPSTIQGSGPGGRLTRKDVLDAAPSPTPVPPLSPVAPPPVAPAPPPAVPPAVPPAQTRPAEAAPAPAPAPAVPPAQNRPPEGASPPVAASEPAPVAAAPAIATANDEVVPFDNIRRRTADHMVRSKATSAHVYTSVEVDFEKVERARAAHKAAWKEREGFSLTYLPFVARAFCDAVHNFPRVNATVGDNALVVHHDVHLSIAVDLDFNGLVAPVIRNADDKRLAAIAHDVHDLALKARNKQLMPDDVLGGTFTITNPGPYGTLMTLAIINQPQVAIMSTDAIKKRPVVVTGPDGDDVIAIHHIGVLALTWDHRAFDGAYAAAFLSAMRDELEGRNWEEELD